MGHQMSVKQKIIEVITSRETQEQIVERIRANPKTSLLALVVVGGFGAAGSLIASSFVIAGWLVGGATALIAAGALLLAKDGDK
jgi:enhancing lycopene biosynthesis protein 2